MRSTGRVKYLKDVKLIGGGGGCRWGWEGGGGGVPLIWVWKLNRYIEGLRMFFEFWNLFSIFQISVAFSSAIADCRRKFPGMLEVLIVLQFSTVLLFHTCFIVPSWCFTWPTPPEMLNEQLQELRNADFISPFHIRFFSQLELYFDVIFLTEHKIIQKSNNNKEHFLLNFHLFKLDTLLTCIVCK